MIGWLAAIMRITSVDLPTDFLKPQHINAFTKALRSKLLDRGSKFGKEYLRVLVNEIRIAGNEAQISGSYSALAGAITETKKGTLGRVPTFASNWLTSSDSNKPK